MAHPATLTMTDIGYTYPGAPTPLFEHVNVTFAHGWSAVLGDNGIGKTTLLHILSGDIRPDSGGISPAPSKLVVRYCAQEIDEIPCNITDFASDWSSAAIGIRLALGIEEDWLHRFGTLSGGEAKRVQIACAMAAGPDVLVLDEPSNHIDAGVRGHVIAAMRAFRGIGIVVSHDRALIDAVCNRCVVFERRHIMDGNITVVATYQGDYSRAAEQIAHRGVSDVKAIAEARRQEARLSDAKTDRFARLQRYESLKRHGERIDSKDHDALARRKGAKSGSGDKNAARNYVQMDSRIAAASNHAAGLTATAKRYDGDIWFDVHASQRNELIHVDSQTLHDWMAGHGLSHVSLAQHMNAALQGSGHVHDGAVRDGATGNGTVAHLSPRPSTSTVADLRSQGTEPKDRERQVGVLPTLSVGPRDHIAIYGPNGSGKTTLLKLLLRRVSPGVPILSIAQNTTARDARAAMTALSGLQRKDRAQALGTYAQLNADPSKLLAGESPSPGELRKLLLCLGTLDRPELIALDEPTNHLDMDSKATLARILAAYPAALVVVSHDEWFLDRVATKQWVLGE